jgi:hypothetical protein
MMNPIIKEIKSTVLGLVLFAIGALYFWRNVNTLSEISVQESFIPFGIILLGIILIFGRDTLIDSLLKGVKGLISKNTK